jgi:hypothetical protein
MKPTKRESHPVKALTSNCKELSARLVLKDCRMVSSAGNLPGARQLPESKTRSTPGDVR